MICGSRRATASRGAKKKKKKKKLASHVLEARPIALEFA
jgi:hypothetical protein